MGSLEKEIEESLGIAATKRYDEENGLVSISGWREHLSSETPILFTVQDKTSQIKWTRLVEHLSKRNTLKVKIPRSAVLHEIVVTAELLRENDSCSKGAKRLKRFTVESTSSCVAIATPENSQMELLVLLWQSMSTSNSKNEIENMAGLTRFSVDEGRLIMQMSVAGEKCRVIATKINSQRNSDRADSYCCTSDGVRKYIAFFTPA